MYKTTFFFFFFYQIHILQTKTINNLLINLRLNGENTRLASISTECGQVVLLRSHYTDKPVLNSLCVSGDSGEVGAEWVWARKALLT